MVPRAYELNWIRPIGCGRTEERISGGYRACGLLAPNLNISASRAISSADFELGVHGALLAQATPDTRFGSDLVVSCTFHGCLMRCIIGLDLRNATCM
jgi:hypothetical protein